MTWTPGRDAELLHVVDVCSAVRAVLLLVAAVVLLVAACVRGADARCERLSDDPAGHQRHCAEATR